MATIQCWNETIILSCSSYVRKPKVLLLDEATSALDLETDSAMQKILKEHFRGCTVVVIAHRLETVITCDNIIVMSSGNVIEEETHWSWSDAKWRI